ncbi:MAG TPA: TadE family protein [Actinospica sp.]|nr:TadE family protein [Actinospica sp.]
MSTVEVVIALPLLVFLMLFMIYLGVKVNLIGQVQNAADDSARMGSAQRLSTVADSEAHDAAKADLNSAGCQGLTVTTSGFAQAGDFTATVTCTKTVFGIDVTVVETGISPIDTYRQAN